jgi:hypothetical protein
MKKIVSSSIERFKSKSYLEIHKGMTAAGTTFARECNGIQSETIKEGICIVQCITCGAHYCNICGKLLGEAQSHTEAGWFYGSTNYKTIHFGRNNVV